jgi:hypothetical protein
LEQIEFTFLHPHFIRDVSNFKFSAAPMAADTQAATPLIAIALLGKRHAFSTELAKERFDALFIREQSSK